MLHVSQAGQPPHVVLRAGDRVSSQAWFDICQVLAPGAAVRHGQPLSVALWRFLGERRRLVAICRPHGIGLVVDQQLQALLQRARDEERFVTALLDRPPGSEIAEPPAGSRFKRDLTWFQLRDYARLQALPHGANFSVPGSGKTAVAYALYETERSRGNAQQLLVVAPLSAFEAWEEEGRLSFADLVVARYSGGYIPSNVEVLLINYQRLASGLDQIAGWCAIRPTHVILDEAHRMKRGRPGVWAAACLDLSLMARRRDVLTGTPAPNHPSDLVALLDFLWPRPGGRRIVPEQALAAIPPDGAMQAVNNRMQSLFVRTTKSELGLPPVTFRMTSLPMGKLQAALYAALRRQYSGTFDVSRRDAATLARLGEVTMYLLQAASNPRLLSKSVSSGLPYVFPLAPLQGGARLAALIEEVTYSRHEVPAKWIALARIVEENRRLGRKTLVWSNFPVNLLDLEGQFAALKPAVVYGGVPSEVDGVQMGMRTREGELRRFRQDEDCWLLLANPQAVAEGMSLHQVCHDAVYLDRTFNAGQYLQSIDRIHRLGLAPEEVTHVTILMSRATIDETIDRRVSEKADRLARMLNDADLVEMALPDDEDYGYVIDTEGDVTALFEHLGRAPEGDDDATRDADGSHGEC